MGTIITLALGRLEVDWGKNSFFSDHGPLFQPPDLKPVPIYQAGLDWPEGDPIVEVREGFGKPLKEVTDRLELLGYTLKSVEKQYATLHRLHDLSEQPIPFEQLSEGLRRVDITAVSGTYDTDHEPGEFVRKEILERLALTSERYSYRTGELRPDHWEVDLLLENFGANSALRLLAENPNNRHLNVTWDFKPLIESGWASSKAFRAGARADQQFLVVTEGSSDASIIRHALALYRPHVADFFRFVDMKDGYPFSGTGNLYRFAQGLVSIGIQNNIVVVLDNDAEGTYSLARASQLALPANMRVLQLPRVAALSQFPTIGPEGSGRADINGCGAAIECYLDLSRPGLPPPVVRWKTYYPELQVYQGELERKAEYVQEFLGLRSTDSVYESSKIEAVLDALIASCVSIAEAEWLAT